MKKKLNLILFLLLICFNNCIKIKYLPKPSLLDGSSEVLGNEIGIYSDSIKLKPIIKNRLGKSKLIYPRDTIFLKRGIDSVIRIKSDKKKVIYKIS